MDKTRIGLKKFYNTEKGKKSLRDKALKQFNNTWKVTRPDGTIDITNNLSEYSDKNNVCKQNMYQAAYRKGTCHGYKIEKLESV